MSTKHLHVLGVCGTAMAAITALAQAQGWRITGSDAQVYPPMSDYLAAMGVDIATFSIDNLQPAPDLCLIGNAMSRGNVEVEYILDHDLPFMSGPAFIGQYILPTRHAAVVTGTHGKTSSASLLAWVLEAANQQPGFMIGGIPENFGEGARLGKSAAHSPFVLEGDEYDTAFFDKRSKFIHYHAKTLVLNNLEFDHADIFEDLAAIKTQFAHLLRTIPQSGNIIANADDSNIMDVIRRGCWTPVTTFAAYNSDNQADWQWQALQEDGSHFRLLQDGKSCIEVTWDSIGKHHVSNACAVAAAATAMGVSKDTIQYALTSFQGVRRRMTKVGEANGITIYDDFAHHPTAIAGIVSSMQAKMKSHMQQNHAGKGSLWVVLEPRSNTMRSNIHQDRLPISLQSADQVIFTPPATRNMEKHDLLDVAKVCQVLQQQHVQAQVLNDVPQIIQHLSQHAQAGDVILILSNGSFDGIHQKLLQSLATNSSS
ncbi:MAG: UDP-N-acetylmuramate:L-alanyl-gamma-D-glutamyl-meso-diaminopimelate ligase [Mariprofundaceae bacterium]|nr:UDP-N-acetylmuramate:L-alanyl-gamma-D-glutamyl-meso-diaminopimelate ligase [Mariprofundaceae bacterium]